MFCVERKKKSSSLFKQSGNERIDGIFGERVIELLAGDPLDFIRETGVLFRVRNASRHRQ